MGLKRTTTLVANSRFVTLSNENFYTTCQRVPYASATSTGGDDVARLYDSAGDDTFEAAPTTPSSMAMATISELITSAMSSRRFGRWA